MEDVEILEVRIEELRSALRELLDGHKELLDPEVLRVSEALDKALIRYYCMKGRKGANSIVK